MNDRMLGADCAPKERLNEYFQHLALKYHFLGGNLAEIAPLLMYQTSNQISLKIKHVLRDAVQKRFC